MAVISRHVAHLGARGIENARDERIAQGEKVVGTVEVSHTCFQGFALGAGPGGELRMTNRNQERPLSAGLSADIRYSYARCAVAGERESAPSRKCSAMPFGLTTRAVSVKLNTPRRLPTRLLRSHACEPRCCRFRLCGHAIVRASMRCGKPRLRVDPNDSHTQEFR